MTQNTADLGAVLAHLSETVAARRTADPAQSYVAAKLAKGVEHCAKKVGEEAVETAMAAVTAAPGDTARLVSESADLLFHLLILWEAAGIAPSEVAAELARREGVSGHAEKASRTS